MQVISRLSVHERAAFQMHSTEAVQEVNCYAQGSNCFADDQAVLFGTSNSLWVAVAGRAA